MSNRRDSAEPEVSRFTGWPKVDLHRHLPGAIRFDTWWRIVNEKHVVVPSDDPRELRASMTVNAQSTLKQFLKCFDLIDLCFVDADAIERITYEAIADAAAENVVYLELRFSPARLAQSADIPMEEVMDAVIAGRRRAAADLPTTVGLIAGLSRELGVGKCGDDARVIATYAGRGIDGIDLLGNEADFAAEDYAAIFRPIAEDGGLGITVHAGEAAGAESVKAAVLQLGATRIGHGVRAEEDPAVLALLAERGVTLEMCPTSNVQTGATQSLATHPLARYLRQGLKVTINTDDPAVSQIDLTHEYGVAASALGLTEAEIAQTLGYAIEAAFAPEETKEQVRKMLGGLPTF